MKKSICFASGLILACALPASAAAEERPYFGNDDSEFARDGECDDVRFVGEGMADALMTDSIGRDAADCRAAFDAGKVTANPMFDEPAEGVNYTYGDDASQFAGDGRCDDIRFTGLYASETIFLAEDIGHDASDCRAAVAAGNAHWQANEREFVFGEDAAS